jgi:hypothetical protein
MLYLNKQIVKANGTMEQEDLMQKNIAQIINIASKHYNLPLSILSQSTSKASDALSRAQTKLRNYWKKNKIGRKDRKIK